MNVKKGVGLGVRKVKNERKGSCYVKLHSYAAGSLANGQLVPSINLSTVLKKKKGEGLRFDSDAMKCVE